MMQWLEGCRADDVLLLLRAFIPSDDGIRKFDVGGTHTHTHANESEFDDVVRGSGILYSPDSGFASMLVFPWHGADEGGDGGGVRQRGE